MTGQGQLPPAKWRGVVKIQQQLGVPGRQATFLVYNEDGSIRHVFPPSKDLRKLLNSRAKAYFQVVLLGDGKLNILKEVSERDW